MLDNSWCRAQSFIVNKDLPQTPAPNNRREQTHAHTEMTLSRRMREAMSNAPWMLNAYICFAVMVTFADYLVLPFTAASFQARLVPYTGWLACMFYSFTIFFAFALAYQTTGRRAMRFTIALMLFLQIVFGTLELWLRTGKAYGNPYLTISPWRPIWTMIIPCIWIAMLYSPRMNRFCPRTDEVPVS